MESVRKKRSDLDPKLHPLQAHIMQVCALTGQIDTVQYKIAVHHFQNFLGKFYQEAHDANEGNNFVDKLFIAISLQHQTPLNHLCLLNSIIDVHLGNNVTKANKMARDLINIPPDPNPSVWIMLSRVLIWLSKSLRSSIQLVLQPLRDFKMKKWYEEKEVDKLCSALRLLKIFIDCFPEVLQEQFIDVHSMILDAMDSNNEQVRIAAKEALKSAIKDQETRERFSVVTLCARLSVIFSEKSWRHYQSALSTAKIIIKTIPSFIHTFNFTSIPFEFLTDKNVEAQTAALKIIPFAFQTTPALITQDTLSTLLPEYKILVAKRSPLRKIAIESLGEILFTLRPPYADIILKLIPKFRQLITDNFDCDQCVFALLAISAINNHPDDFMMVFARPMSKQLIEALVRYLQVHPENTSAITRQVVSMGSEEFLGQNQPRQLVLTCRAFVRLEVKASMFTLPLVFQVAIFLNHPDLEVRTAIADFVLFYYHQKPDPDVAQLLLSAVCTDSVDDLRLSILKHLRQEQFFTVCIPMLQTLLHDVCSEVKYEALRMLSQSASEEVITRILVDFITEKVSVLKNTEYSKEAIRCILIVTTELSTESAHHIVVPFSPFLIRHILAYKTKLPSAALMLLSKLIPYSSEDIDVDRLVNCILSSLVVHSDERRIDAALDLLLAALNYTSISESIYGRHFEIVRNLVTLGHITNLESRKKLLEALTSIGITRHEILSHGDTQISSENSHTNNYFITHSESNDPYTSLVFASVGISLTHIMNVLFNESLSALHPAAIESLITILKSHRQIGGLLEDDLLKKINRLLTHSGMTTVMILLANMTTLIAVLGDRFEPLVPHVVEFVCSKWNFLDRFQLIRITEWLINSVPDATEQFLPRLASVFLAQLDTYEQKVVDAVFSVFVSFGDKTRFVAHIVYPVLLQWISMNAGDVVAFNENITKLQAIFVNCGTERYSSEIVRAVVLAGQSSRAVHDKILDLLCVVAAQCGKQFLLFLPRLSAVFDLSSNQMLTQILTCTNSDLPLSGDAFTILQPTTTQKAKKDKNRQFVAPPRTTRDLPEIKPAYPNWNKGQWLLWSDEMFSVIVKNSPSKAISACHLLVERHPSIRDAIYPLAFAIYYVLNNNIQFPIFDVVFSAKNVPRSITRHFLAVIELLEILDMPLPVKPGVIAENATRVGLLPQALRASEVLFDRGVVEMTEKLIVLNQDLGLPLAANGILKQSRLRNFASRQDVLAERLGLWEDALEIIDKNLEKTPEDENLRIRRFKCLAALSKYDQLKDFSVGKTSYYRAVVDLHMFDYEAFAKSAGSLVSTREDTAFYKSIFYLIENDRAQAEELVSQIREESAGQIFPMISEDYERSESLLMRVAAMQQISEGLDVKELIVRAGSAIPAERKIAQEGIAVITKKWHSRFTIMPKRTPYMHMFLCIAGAVLPLTAFESEVVALLNVLIQKKSFNLAKHIIATLQKEDPNAQLATKISIISKRIEYEENKTVDSLAALTQMIPSVDAETANFLAMTVAGAYNERGDTKSSKAVLETVGEKSSPEVYEMLSRANLNIYESDNNQECLRNALVCACDGLKRNPKNSLTLALLILSIVYREDAAGIVALFSEYASEIPTECWTAVIPRIFARLTDASTDLNKEMIEVVYKVGIEHPFSVMYPLLVPLKSDNERRKEIGLSLISRFRDRHNDIVRDILLLSDELMRVAVTWEELVFGQIDEASRLFYPNNDIEGCLTALKPLKEILKKKPESFMEVSFMSKFGISLNLAVGLIEKYEASKEIGFLQAAWKELSSIFNRLRNASPSNTIDTSEASPVLASFNSKIAVPGSYNPGLPIVSIESFCSTLRVMNSKQRPRKMHINGSDGIKYRFLLKAHEDTRLDERVMQLFDFINSLLNRSNNGNLHITTYKVTPLTGEVGLIGWVDDCLTISDLIREHRRKRNIPFYIEQLETQKYAPNYEVLSVNDKLVAFRRGLSVSDGDDLKRVLLTNAPDSGRWLQQRNTYASSMAVTSMAGYLLGLGDRHLSNIMMGRSDGRLVHIDFGDCFEVAMHRSLYPETVPFRLTRIMENALEVSRIEGTFRSCCESTMSLFRASGDQILSLLEAFIYDPLLQWSSKEGEPVEAISRIRDKLNGADIEGKGSLNVSEQVNELIQQATNPRNLCQMFIGWLPWL